MRAELERVVEQCQEQGVARFVEQIGIRKLLPLIPSDDVPFDGLFDVVRVDSQDIDYYRVPMDGGDYNNLSLHAERLGIDTPSNPSVSDILSLITASEMVHCAFCAERQASQNIWWNVRNEIKDTSFDFYSFLDQDDLSIVMRSEPHIYYCRYRDRIVIDNEILENMVSDHVYRSCAYALDLSSARCEYLDMRNVDLSMLPSHMYTLDHKSESVSCTSFITDEGMYLWSIVQDKWDYQLRCVSAQRIVVDYSRAQKIYLAYDLLGGLRVEKQGMVG